LEKEDLQKLQKNERSSSIFDYNNFDCSNLHRNIKLEVIKPKINMNLKRAYQNIVSKYRLTINSYSSQIAQYLKMDIEEKEEKKLFGSGLSSRNFGDPKGRFWHRKSTIQGIPDIGFLFLVDGSGSMEGGRMNGVISSMVIIHEVFKNNNIQHSIVEHRAIYDKPKLNHNILVDFQHKNEEKYNILRLNASEGTREGFSLYWAEKHLNKSCLSEYKVIIMISDGAPAHTCDDPIDYVPPVSIKDTAEAAKKIIKRGTSVVALALDAPEDDECYRQLKMIYPNVVSCIDINKLTGQLLHVISKLFQGRIR
jgi:nitric oxide reductase activation protein